MMTRYIKGILAAAIAATSLCGCSISRKCRAPELNLFYPVCRRYASPGERPAALLIVGINTEKMLHYVAAEDENLHIRLLTADGVVLVSEHQEQTGIKEERFGQYAGMRGQFACGDDLVVYQY